MEPNESVRCGLYFSQSVVFWERVVIQRFMSPYRRWPPSWLTHSIDCFQGHKGEAFPSRGRGCVTTTWQVLPAVLRGGSSMQLPLNLHLPPKSPVSPRCRGGQGWRRGDVMSTDAGFQVTLYFGVIGGRLRQFCLLFVVFLVLRTSENNPMNSLDTKTFAQKLEVGKTDYEERKFNLDLWLIRNDSKTLKWDLWKYFGFKSFNLFPWEFLLFS